MKKSLQLILLLITGLTLSGCKLNFITSVHMTHLHNVAFNQATDVTTPTTIEIQIPSKSECDEYADTYIDFIEEFVIDAIDRGCAKKGSEAYLAIEVETPIVDSIEAWEEANTLFGVFLADADDQINVFVMNNSALYGVLEKKMRNKFDIAPDLSNVRVSVFLNNFRRHEYLLVRGIFLNQDPIDNFQEIQYRRRQRRAIGLSDVGIAHLESKGHAFAFAFKK